MVWLRLKDALAGLPRLHAMLAVLPYIFFGLRLESIPAVPGAEIIGLAHVVECLVRSREADLHAADRILECGFFVLLALYI